MKRNLITILVIGMSINFFGQDTTTYFFKSNWKKTKQSKAFFKREIIKFNDKYVNIETTINGDTLVISELKSYNPYIENGFTMYFDNNLKLIAKGYYVDGLLDSIWFVYNQIDKKIDTLNYSGIKINYITNQEFYKEETFIIANQMPIFIYGDSISDKREMIRNQIKEASKLMGNFENKNDPEFIKVRDNYSQLQMEHRNIEIENFKKYIIQNQYYPIRSRKNNKQGKVYVQVVVSPEGKLIEPKIIKGVVKELDNKVDDDLYMESLRLIKESPEWIPGQVNGKPVRVQLVLVFEFKE